MLTHIDSNSAAITPTTPPRLADLTRLCQVGPSPTKLPTHHSYHNTFSSKLSICLFVYLDWLSQELITAIKEGSAGLGRKECWLTDATDQKFGSMILSGINLTDNDGYGVKWYWAWYCRSTVTNANGNAFHIAIQDPSGIKEAAYLKPPRILPENPKRIRLCQIPRD